MTVLLLAIIVVLLLAIFGVQVAKYVERLEALETPTEEPLKVREWAKEEDDYRLRVTLEDGTTWHGFNLWWWSDQGNAPEDLCRRLCRFQKQIALV